MGFQSECGQKGEEFCPAQEGSSGSCVDVHSTSLCRGTACLPGAEQGQQEPGLVGSLGLELLSPCVIPDCCSWELPCPSQEPRVSHHIRMSGRRSLMQPIDPGVVFWISFKSLLQCRATFSGNQISLASVLMRGEVVSLWTSSFLVFTPCWPCSVQLRAQGSLTRADPEEVEDELCCLIAIPEESLPSGMQSCWKSWLCVLLFQSLCSSWKENEGAL